MPPMYPGGMPGPPMPANGAMGMAPPGGLDPSPRLVAHLSNLNESVVSCDALFTLVGVYGNVQRVKIFFPKKDQALVQVADGDQANTAIRYLNGMPLFGKPIHCSLSKHHIIQSPNLKEDQPNANLFKDYSDSQFHRFKKPGSKNEQNIYPASKTLHVSNIPGDMSEADIVQLFTPYGTVDASRLIPSQQPPPPAPGGHSQMALVQMSSVEESVTSLIALHNYELVPSQHLHLTFARQQTL